MWKLLVIFAVPAVCPMAQSRPRDIGSTLERPVEPPDVVSFQLRQYHHHHLGSIGLQSMRLEIYCHSSLRIEEAKKSLLLCKLWASGCGTSGPRSGGHGTGSSHRETRGSG
jgi:hypothetical protein